MNNNEMNHLTIEKKWQDYWEKNKTFYTDMYDFSKPKYYALSMFPYPSGDGLHVGHPRNYIPVDITARFKRMQGYNVLHPIGWDAFGLPAEQFAIKTGNHPEGFTRKNIKNFTRQLKALGLSYDWSKEICTADEDYYKWSQWIFIKMFEKDLAYLADTSVNWCEELKTVLANEEVVDGKSEVGGFPVIRKSMSQWMLKITAYAEELLKELDSLDWPSSTKEMQKNWIGKSIGSIVKFKVANSKEYFEVFTTRADTLFGATYCVISPEHPLVNKITTTEQKEEIYAYQKACLTKSDLERTDLNKDKTGAFTGAYAVNPLNNKEIPIYISDYVLMNYGTGAIMAVPAHDTRDFDFAKKFNIDIIQVLQNPKDKTVSELTEAYVEDGIHINSMFINGLYKDEAIKKINEFLVANNCGYSTITYKLRDWIFSRQRYWGEPFPVVYIDGKPQPMNEEDLPLVLPPMTDFTPTGKPPLANIDSFINLIVNGKEAHREANTMPQTAGSSWYFLRYIDPHNNKEIADKKLLDHWMPVDLYMGGSEHAVGHLLYARFFHKFLRDCGVVDCNEPFKKLFHQGMILGENNEKMSKSRGNVVNPDVVIEEYGADTLRVYEMFMGPLDSSFPWKNASLAGAKKWLERVYRLITSDKISDINDHYLDTVYHQTVKKVTEDYENLAFNTAISQMMIFINAAYKAESLYKEYAINFILMLSCIAPHLGEELYQHLTNSNKSLAYETFPVYDEKYLIRDTIELAIQVNGKLRGTINANIDCNEDELKNLAVNEENVKKHLEGKVIKKIIVVKNKIVNIVV